MIYQRKVQSLAKIGIYVVGQHPCVHIAQFSALEEFTITFQHGEIIWNMVVEWLRIGEHIILTSLNGDQELTTHDRLKQDRQKIGKNGKVNEAPNSFIQTAQQSPTRAVLEYTFKVRMVTLR